MKRQEEMTNHQQYTVSEKLDGVRYLLVLGRYDYHTNNHNIIRDPTKPTRGTVIQEKKSEPFSVMVDRNMTAYEVAVEASETYFDGTVVDGELVVSSTVSTPTLKQKQQTFMVFDIACCAANTALSSP